MSLNPALKIRTQLTEVLEVHGFGHAPADRVHRLHEMLAEVLLPADDKFLARYPHQLSGRPAAARSSTAMAFACQPSVIVLDEPTTGLDVTTQAHVLETIRQLTVTHNVAALYVTHDLAVIAEVARSRGGDVRRPAGRGCVARRHLRSLAAPLHQEAAGGGASGHGGDQVAREHPQGSPRGRGAAATGMRVRGQVRLGPG